MNRNFTLFFITLILVSGITYLSAEGDSPSDPSEISRQSGTQTEDPGEILITEQQILDAIKNYDMPLLTELLKGTDDVKTIVTSGAPLLHMAEEAMGYGGLPSEMTQFLVEKKAWILQKDAKGRSLNRLMGNMELYGSPRAEYIEKLIGDGFSILINALRNDSVEDLETLEGKLPFDNDLLQQAAKEKGVNITRYLLTLGVDVNKTEVKSKETALHKACGKYPSGKTYEDRAEIAELLIAAGADVQAADKNGYAAIQHLFQTIQADYSGKMGSPDRLLTLLLKNGADPNALLQNQPLMYWAANAKMIQTVQLLLDNGAEINKQSLSALNQTKEIIELFLERGADPVLLIPMLKVMQNAPEEQSDLMNLLIKKGAKAQDFDLIAVYKNREALEYLVSHGANPADSNILVTCLLNYNGMEIIQYLVENGADVHKKYRNNMTALHYAVKGKKDEAALYFIEKGADINALDNKSKTPLDYCRKTSTDLSELLIAAGARKSSEL